MPGHHVRPGPGRGLLLPRQRDGLLPADLAGRRRAGQPGQHVGGKVVAVSADQTDAAAAWGKADAPAGISLSSPYTPALTGTYYVGFMVAATVMPTVAAADRAGGPPADLAPACCVLGGTRLTAPPAVGSAVAPREPAGGDIYFWLS